MYTRIRAVVHVDVDKSIGMYASFVINENKNSRENGVANNSVNKSPANNE